MRGQQDAIVMNSFLFLLWGLVSLVTAEGELPIVADGFPKCQKVRTFVSTTFSNNVMTALGYLMLHSSAGAREAMTVVGDRDQNNVYAAFQCNVNISAEHCKRCTINALIRIRKSHCLLRGSFHTTMEGCFLRYDNHSYGPESKKSESTKLQLKEIAREAPTSHSSAHSTLKLNSEPKGRSSDTIPRASMPSRMDRTATAAAREISVFSFLDSFQSLDCPNNMAPVSTGFSNNFVSALAYLKAMSSMGRWHATSIFGKRVLENVGTSFQCRTNMFADLSEHCKDQVLKLLRKDESPLSVHISISVHGCFAQYESHSLFSFNETSFSGMETVALKEIRLMLKESTNFPAKPPSSTDDGESGSFNLSRKILQEFLVPAPLPSDVLTPTISPQRLAQSPPSPPLSSDLRASPPAPPQSPRNTAIAPAPEHSPTGGKLVILIVTVVSVSCVVVALALLLGLVCLYRHKRKANEKKIARAAAERAARLEERRKNVPKQAAEKVASPSLAQGSVRSSILVVGAREFSLKEVQAATRNFDRSMMLGAGGFGVVYRGILPGGEEVAIKRLQTENSRENPRSDFLNEAHIIQKVQHRNLIRLLGACEAKGERILVYEYMKNGSLYDYLHRDDTVLEWSDRYNIITGISKGLAYLHEESHYKIVHGDIKPQNILLNERLEAVLADFGIARLLEDGRTQRIPRLIGTPAYLPPEYRKNRELRPSVDSYSFGVVCLEIICGNRNDDLIDTALRMYEDKMWKELVDHRIEQRFSVQEVDLVLQIAFLCVQSDYRRRPPMSSVARWLPQKSISYEFLRSLR
ncbi:hypothetical protein KP509_12G091900 [Ceratopteris richardii]|uniref:Uncharacterized protein n=1 Tax=Ceratopteris richardii TaxID=49495 RepID=A0A8T2TL47_CERRI|nr:hypothetical protein KP509_12G091900 [Ceratopteris richardii]